MNYRVGQQGRLVTAIHNVRPRTTKTDRALLIDSQRRVAGSDVVQVRLQRRIAIASP